MGGCKGAGVRRVFSIPFSIRRAACAFALFAGLVLVASVARADPGSRSWNDYLLHATKCQDAINNRVSEGTRCLFGHGLTLMLDQTLRLADSYGKMRFGQHFQVAGNFSYSSVSSEFGIEGDLDMVLPFAGTGLPASRSGVSSFFFQQGITRSWDGSGSGLFRNDLRQGVVRRFRVSRTADADIVGFSAFHLLNLERGHRVLAPGIDYAGRWGTGSARYFIPTTGWRPSAQGYEERALEGFELGIRFDLTTTLRLNTVGYRWRAEDGSNEWNTGARMNLDWRPHPWLKLGVGYDGIARGEDSTSFRVALRVPFGGPSERPAWEGLGLAAGGGPPAADYLWRPTEDIATIRVAKRQSVASLVDNAEVKFLQDTVGSGESVQVEVSLPAAAPEEIRVELRLVPGSGENPAVPGEDYVDELIEITIAKGATSGRASIQLLRNDELRENRSLGVTVSLVG